MAIDAAAHSPRRAGRVLPHFFLRCLDVSSDVINSPQLGDKRCFDLLAIFRFFDFKHRLKEGVILARDFLHLVSTQQFFRPCKTLQFLLIVLFGIAVLVAFFNNA